jgi:hypothetical protein
LDISSPVVVAMVRVLSPSPSSLAHRILFLEMATTPKAASASKLLTRVRRAAWVHHYSPPTEVARVAWVRRFVRYHGLSSPMAASGT